MRQFQKKKQITFVPFGFDEMVQNVSNNQIIELD